MRRLMEATATACCVAGVTIVATSACAKSHDAAPAPSPPAVPAQASGEGGLNPNAHAADMAYQTFAGGCAPNLSRPEVMQLVMGGIGLKEAPDRVATQIPHEAGDRVWVLPHPGVGVVAVWNPDGRRCQVLMQRGDLSLLKKAFSELLTSTAKPGLAVDKVKDVVAAGPDGPVETLAYEVYATPKRSGGDDRIYTLTLHRGEDAKAAATLEGARLGGTPPGDVASPGPPSQHG